MFRLLATIMVLVFLSGCATPIPKSETIPVFSGKPTATIAIVVADHRSFILSGNKKEWFEGIFRSAYGIPLSLTRIDEFKEKPFAFYLASKLKESLDGAGSTATIIQVPKGSSVETIVDKIVKANVGSALAVIIHQSRYDIGAFSPEYGYHFELFVFDGSGRKLAQKSFQKMEKPIALSEKYNLFDFMSEMYKKRFDTFLNDPEIKSALTQAAAGS